MSDPTAPRKSGPPYDDPRTAAGRALMEAYRTNGSQLADWLNMRNAILAIEAEAAANTPRTALDADHKHANIVGKDRCKCGAKWHQGFGGGWKGYSFHLEDVLTRIAIEAEAAAPAAPGLVEED